MPTPSEILALAAEGHSAAEVATRLGCGLSTVYRTLRRAGLTPGAEGWPWPRVGRGGRPRTYTLELVRPLAQRGFSIRAAAQELGCTPRAVRLILERNETTWAALREG